MRVAVIGLGGVGGYIAAKLALTEHEVVGFARGAHLEAIVKSGLRIEEEKESWHVNLDARKLEDADGYFDIVLFCVKSYDLMGAYEAISNYIDKDTVLLSISNGVDNADVLRVLSDSLVLEGCAYILSHISSAGVIRKKGDVFAIVFGGYEDASARMAKLCEDAGLRYKNPEEIKEAIWKKYIFICAFATATSYYNNTIGYVMEHHKSEVKSLLQEIASVAKSKGIHIEDEIEKSLATAQKLPYDATTSMYLDYKNGKKTELKSLSGYIVKEAAHQHIEVPTMKRLYKELKERQATL